MEYSEEEKAEYVRKVLSLVEEGKSLRKACEEIGIPRTTFEVWEKADEKIAVQYAHAREKRADHIFEEMLQIADTPKIGTIETAKEWGTEVQTKDMVDHRKLQIETRKWMLGKMAPKRFGDRLDLTHANPDGSALTVKILRLGDAEKADS